MNLPERPRLADLLGDELQRLGRIARDRVQELEVDEVGVVTSVGSGIATVRGLPRVRADEVVRFAGGEEGLALDLRRDDVGVVGQGHEVNGRSSHAVRGLLRRRGRFRGLVDRLNRLRSCLRARLRRGRVDRVRMLGGLDRVDARFDGLPL